MKNVLVIIILFFAVIIAPLRGYRMKFNLFESINYHFHVGLRSGKITHSIFAYRVVNNYKVIEKTSEIFVDS